jgi:hypothetical protein
MFKMSFEMPREDVGRMLAYMLGRSAEKRAAQAPR